MEYLAKPNPDIHAGWMVFAALVPCITAVASYYGARTVILGTYLLLGLSVLILILRPQNDQTLLALTASISLSLILSFTLTSSNLIGWDIHGEYYQFTQVITNGTWDSSQALHYNAAVSISILPTIIDLVTTLNGVRIFKFVFPIIFSMVPVVVYKFYRRFLKPQFAFMAVFLFMSYPAFYQELVELGREEVAQLILVLLLLLFLSPRISRKRSGTFMVVGLTVGLVLAHYSLTYIYLAMLAFSYIFARISRRVLSLDSLTILLSIVIAISWYLFVASGSTLSTLVQFISYVNNGIFQDFFTTSSRPVQVLQAFGLASVRAGALHVLNRFIQYLVLAGMFFGFIVVTCKRQKNDAERKMVPLITMGVVMMGMSVLIPFFAAGLNLSRIFQIALISLAPCLIYGTEKIQSVLRSVAYLSKLVRFKSLPTKRPALAALLVCYFLFVSGWTWAVTLDRPTSFVLDSQRMKDSNDPLLLAEFYSEYTVPSDVAGASWARIYAANSPICGDYVSMQHVLNSYGNRPRPAPIIPYGECLKPPSYIFLGELNSFHGIGIDDSGATWPIVNITLVLQAENRIYSGGSTISSPPP